MIVSETVTKTKVVEVSPGKTPEEVGVEPGGVIEFRNVFQEYPFFEIVFAEPGPPNPSDDLTGSIEKPIFVHMPDANLCAGYYIVYSMCEYHEHHKHHKHHKLGEGEKFVKSCPGCGSKK